MDRGQLACSAEYGGYGFRPAVPGGGFGDAFLAAAGGKQCLVKRDDGRFQFEPLPTIASGVEILTQPDSADYALQPFPQTLHRSSSTPTIRKAEVVEPHLPFAKIQLPPPTPVGLASCATTAATDGNRQEEEALREQLDNFAFCPPDRVEMTRQKESMRASAVFGKASGAALLEGNDRLRGKLLDVGQSFVGFDRQVEDDTRRRRATELQRLGEIHEGLARLERALNVEIKRRIEISKSSHRTCEHVLGDMLGRVQSKLIERFEHLTHSIESLQGRCLTLERGMQQFRGELPSKLQVETASLVRGLQDLGQDFEVDRRRRSEQDAYFLRVISEAEHGVDVRMESELIGLERRAETLQQLSEDFAAPNAERETAQEAVLQDIVTMKTAFAREKKVRQQTDDEVVQAINEYTGALHRSIGTANR